MNEHEARARSIKAFKIARVLVRVVDELDRDDALDVAAGAPDEIRLRVAALANVSTRRPPSDETWAQALVWVRLFRQRR